ncbi:MAG: hypothetical protein L3J43_05740 [Sulfurovum sp.]|nr:hypothetical protein [Sulfurovum sp.]
MLNISPWYNNFQAPSVLMIDDLSDAYIHMYHETYKNDWGLLCGQEGSAFSFLTQHLLQKFPDIKITFFVPYLKHNVIHEGTSHKYKKYAVGEREDFTSFLKALHKQEHEIAHHGSDHGMYDRNNTDPLTSHFVHEWELFDEIKRGVEVTQQGIERFKKEVDIDISGGKFCGYMQRGNSLDIIDKCNFLYWSDTTHFKENNPQITLYGENNILLFPTTYSGNSFVRLSYKTEEKRKDNIKRFTKYLQPLYNIVAKARLRTLYKNRSIISIQEHYSPSTTRGKVQSANFITDIDSLHKIYTFLNKRSIWYATCEEIAKYYYTKEHSKISIKKDKLTISFNNPKHISNTQLSLTSQSAFTLKNTHHTFISKKNNGLYVVNLPIIEGSNLFTFYT